MKQQLYIRDYLKHISSSQVVITPYSLLKQPRLLYFANYELQKTLVHLFVA